MNGLLVINKSLHISSMDVIRRIRRLTGIKKVGHAGTLDPLATGVLLVCIGPATKKIQSLMGLDKTYLTTIDLSAYSETDDAQGPIHPITVAKIPTQQEIEAILPEFLGTIAQVPPRYSAIKINGRAAYKRARNDQEEFTLPPRMVTIDAIKIISYQWPYLTLDIACKTGTYIRSLGKGIGTRLNVGGYLTKLERTSIGPFSSNIALNLDNLIEIEENDIISLDDEFDKRK